MPLSKENRMQMAISAIQNKKIQSKREAASVFGVSEATLRNRLKGMKSRSETRASGHKLTDFEEEALVKQLLDADKQGFSIQPQYLREMAQILLHKCTQDSTATIGVNWASSFIRRRPELRTRYNRRITYQRAKQEDPKVLNQWFETVHAAIQEHGIHEDDIWNFDETGFAMGLCTTSKVITAVERSERPRTVIQGNREWVTIIECINSKGISIPPVVILKGKEHQAPWYQEPNLHPAWKLTNSANGWTTDEIGLKWLKQVFDPFSKPYSTGAKRLLILDGHSSHQTAEFDNFCKENAIICLCMPPHTSHLLQPLDVGIFGPLKRAYGKLVETMMVAGNNHIDKVDFLHLYSPAHDQVFTGKNICNGFAGAGLKPFDKGRVLKKITFQLRTPTPPLIEAEGSISSALQTPQNPRQIDRKVRSLQRSLQKKRTLSSSPISHIQHLEQAAQMAMNMNLLLLQENKVLRAENERKKKKKARTHGSLGTDLFMSVQEGCERIQQLDTQLNAQVDEPIPVTHQRAPPRCSCCGTVGHTIRRCPSK
ncbi:hypothetical protein SI65_03050 [Aspergillus cristatus]|uniref:HTH CENPB-type domain-containing protein n=1 Tax=Aspergillus cristatus TaxID=573508 RepID=A0A1E3BMK7_ASPCR|nr:hypothetical protein SI65_03050 [Aspergillus cristatus]